MADRLNEGYGDVSDNGGNKTLQGFELNRKIDVESGTGRTATTAVKQTDTARRAV